MSEQRTVHVYKDTKEILETMKDRTGIPMCKILRGLVESAYREDDLDQLYSRISGD